MMNRSNTNNLRAVLLLISIIILGGVLALATSAGQAGKVATQEETWYGIYTDKTSYAPGEAIQIYASAESGKSVFRLIRLDDAWSEVERTAEIEVGPQSSTVGSFIEYPGVSLANRSKFTLEGWFHPTLLGGDLSVVAGQIGETEAAAGIVVLPDGRLAGYVSDTAPLDPAKLAIGPEPPNPAAWKDVWLDKWHHLALTYDGAEVTFYIDGNIAASHELTGTVASVDAPFRLGARAEAPGDLTGVIDGRIDSWALWDWALDATQIEARRQRGLNEADPAPLPAEVELFVGFEGAFPSIADSSHNNYSATVTNYGNPGVTGVISPSRAFRLNHDQIVDAGWSVTTVLTVPQGTDSGMYAIQALTNPPFEPTQDGNRLSVRALAIRPAPADDPAPIAVVLPTNTWLAYMTWPQFYDPYLAGDGITARSRFPGGPIRDGGNNSAYAYLGDGVSKAYYHGWRRPAHEVSPMKPSATIGEYSVRAPNSMYMVQWLDEQGFAYDVFSDDDFDAGVISAADYRVLMPHSHHEYWSMGMLDTLTQFLNDGGSVVAPAGNIFTWQVVYDADRVLEVRKIGEAPVLGLADMLSGINGIFMSTLTQSAICNEDDSYFGGARFQALGVNIHLHKPCDNGPFCFGQWHARNSDHWLWRGSGLSEDESFGIGRPASVLTPTFAVGHEADTWVEDMPLFGLADGQQAVILAEGLDFDPNDPGGRNSLLENIGNEPPTCDEIKARFIQGPEGNGATFEPTQAGTILYFPHSSGGHVLVIGASATPWALDSDAFLSGLLYKALACFALDEGCNQELFLPVILKDTP